MTPGAAIAVVLAVASTAAATQSVVVPSLPEPTPSRAREPADASWVKPPYASLANPRAIAFAALAGAASGAVAVWGPSWRVPVMALAAGPMASLVVVDALTTYLPRRLDRLCWLLALAGCLASAAEAPAPGALGVRCAGAAMTTAALFWAIWRVSGTLGWGDVRLAPLLALAPSAVSWTAWFHFLFLGTLAGALWGTITWLWRRRHPHPLGQVFPYGPGLWVGSTLAVLLG